MRLNFQEFSNRNNKIRINYSPEGYIDYKIKYDLAIVATELVDYSQIFTRSVNQIFFGANTRLDYIGKCEHFFILRKSSEIEFVWTSFRDKPAILDNKNLASIYDFFFLKFVKPNQKILCLGNCFEGCMAAFKNNCNIDAYEFNKTEYDFALQEFKRCFTNQELPF